MQGAGCREQEQGQGVGAGCREQEQGAGCREQGAVSMGRASLVVLNQLPKC